MEGPTGLVRSPMRRSTAFLWLIAFTGIGCFADDPEKLWISEPPPGSPPGCVLPDTDAGTEGGVSVNCPQRSDIAEQSLVYFKNNYTDRTIDVNWVNFSCVEEKALTGIEPGQQQQTITYVTHVWHVRDSDTNEFLSEVIIEDVSPGRVFEVGP